MADGGNLNNLFRNLPRLQDLYIDELIQDYNTEDDEYLSKDHINLGFEEDVDNITLQNVKIQQLKKDKESASSGSTVPLAEEAFLPGGAFYIPMQNGSGENGYGSSTDSGTLVPSEEESVSEHQLEPDEPTNAAEVLQRTHVSIKCPIHESLEASVLSSLEVPPEQESIDIPVIIDHPPPPPNSPQLAQVPAQPAPSERRQPASMFETAVYWMVMSIVFLVFAVTTFVAIGLLATQYIPALYLPFLGFMFVVFAVLFAISLMNMFRYGDRDADRNENSQPGQQ